MVYISVIILVLFGIGLTIQRMINNAGQRKTTGKLLKNIAADKNKAEALAKNLYYKYASWPCAGAKDLDDLVHNIKQVKEAGKFTIELIESLAGNRYLLVTTCTDNDFDMSIAGKMGDAKKIYNLNFVLAFDEQKQEIVVSSENFYSSVDKGLRTSFANLVRQFY